jgi:hypothetical protein
VPPHRLLLRSSLARWAAGCGLRADRQHGVQRRGRLISTAQHKACPPSYPLELPYPLPPTSSPLPSFHLLLYATLLINLDAISSLVAQAKPRQRKSPDLFFKSSLFPSSTSHFPPSFTLSSTFERNNGYVHINTSSCPHPVVSTIPIILAAALQTVQLTTARSGRPVHFINSDMKTFTTVALGLIGAAVASASDVASLTKDTFPDFVNENPLVLAECK